MPRLSIVITSCGDTDRLEASLVSVLSNRPADAEVLVVSSVPYDDPYDLAGEVRFVEIEETSRWTDCANVGILESTAPVVHLLAAGVETSEGWADEALSHFHDPQVAAVVPVAYRDARRKHIAAAGVSYGRGGTRRIVRGRTTRLRPIDLQGRVVGPTRWAGFYRKEALAEPVGMFASAVGDEAADVELGLRLRHAGYLVEVEPASVVSFDGVQRRRSSEYRRAMGAERLFWRHVGLSGWKAALVWHALTVIGGLASSLVRLSIVGQIAGRFMGAMDMVRHARYRRRLAKLPGTAAERSVLPISRGAAQRSGSQGRTLRKSA